MGRQQEPIEQFFQVSLLGLLVSGFLALAFSSYLDVPTIILTSAGFLLRAVSLSRRGVRWQISPSVANALTVAYVGFYPLDYLYLSREFIPSAVHLICFLAVIRILSAQSNRDYSFVKVIAFLELVAATLLSANISFFLFLTLFVVFGVANFCCSEIRRSSQRQKRIAETRLRFHGRLAVISAAITVSIVLMTVGLFVILPRTAGAAFRKLVPEKYHVTGFSNEISLGQIGRIQQSTQPLVHVQIVDVNRTLPLKWRGGALTQFDGRRWYNPPARSTMIPVVKGQAILADDDQRRRSGSRITYYVRVDSMDADTLFFAGIPEAINIDVSRLYRTPTGAFRTGQGYGYRAQYSASSYLARSATQSFLPRPLAPESVVENLLLPDVDRRIIDLARSLDKQGTVGDRGRAIEQYLRNTFTYTTDLLTQEVKDPLAHFLFDRKQGHCEYFASAMAVMLRVNRIPSRVVTGFQSGVYNPMTGWHVLRASDAHSWVEAWSPEEGWMTFDPTPPANAPQGKPWGTFALYLDAAEMFWQRWIIDYDLNHQLYLASRFEQSARALNGVSSNRWWTNVSGQMGSILTDLKKLSVLIGMAAFFGALLWLMAPVAKRALHRFRYARKIRQEGAAASDAAVLYLQMLEILRKRGFEKPAWLTPHEFARVLPSSKTAELVHEFTTLYQNLRYGGMASAGERMLEVLQELEEVDSQPAAR